MENITTYSAIILEPRKHPAFEMVLLNFLENLGSDWTIIILHGLKNMYYLLDLINTKFLDYIDRIKLVKLKIIDLTIKDYNKILCSTDFYKHIPTEIFLIFQLDTLICPLYKDLIYNFLNYDYVGAPWINKNKVGNGGLSLRKKSAMLKIINENPLNIKGDIQEDYFFSDLCYNKPTVELAKEFSIETMYTTKSFGIHKPWLYLEETEIEEMCKIIPNLRLLININNKYSQFLKTNKKLIFKKMYG